MMGGIEFGHKEMMLSKESFDAVMQKIQEEKEMYKNQEKNSIDNNNFDFDELVKMLTKPFHDAFTKKVDPLDKQRKQVIDRIIRGGLVFK